jgi:hypothetical protein
MGAELSCVVVVVNKWLSITLVAVVFAYVGQLHAYAFLSAAQTYYALAC